MEGQQEETVAAGAAEEMSGGLESRGSVGQRKSSCRHLWDSYWGEFVLEKLFFYRNIRL